jgi:hypothetical protein
MNADRTKTTMDRINRINKINHQSENPNLLGFCCGLILCIL